MKVVEREGCHVWSELFLLKSFREVSSKLSEIAHQRRGHNKAYFILRWRATLAMVLAKKGSEVALLRAFKVRQAQRGHSGIAEADEDSGPMLDADADAFIHGGFD